MRQRAVCHGGFDRVERALQVRRHEDHVAPGGKRLYGGLACGIVVGDGGHGLRVGDDDVLVAELVPQDVGHDGGGEIGGRVAAGYVRVGQVRDHDERDAPFLRDDRLEGDQVAAFQLTERFFHDGRAVVIVDRGAAVAGEVLEAGDDALCPQTLDDDARERRAQLRIRAERAAADHAVNAGDDVAVRREIQIEAEAGQIGRERLPGGIDLRGIGALAEGAHVGDLRAAQRLVRADAADRAALLIHAQKQRDLRIRLRVGEQRGGLRPVFEIFGKIDDAADRVLRERIFCRLTGHRSGIDVRDGLRRDEEQLPELFILRHGGEGGLCGLLRVGDGGVVRRGGIRGGLGRLLAVRLLRLRGLGLIGQLALIRRFALRLHGGLLGGEDGVGLDGLGLLRLLLFRERLPKKHAYTAEQRDAEQDGENGG